MRPVPSLCLGRLLSNHFPWDKAAFLHDKNLYPSREIWPISMGRRLSGVLDVSQACLPEVRKSRLAGRLFPGLLVARMV